MTTTQRIGIHEILRENRVRVHLEGSTKSEVLGRLIDMLAGDERVSDFEAVRDAVLKREEIMSTGVGKGLALPHAKTNSVSELTAVFATTASPIHFDSVDDEPVRMMFLVVSGVHEKTRHLKLLSRVSRLMNDAAFRTQLLEARTSKQLLDVFKRGELELS